MLIPAGQSLSCCCNINASPHIDIVVHHKVDLAKSRVGVPRDIADKNFLNRIDPVPGCPDSRKRTPSADQKAKI